MKLFRIFFLFVFGLFVLVSCSDSGGGDDPTPSTTLTEATLSAQQWAVVEFNGEGKQFISALVDPNIADDTIRNNWDYLNCVGVLVCEGSCNQDNTLRFDASANVYEMLTNGNSCSNNSQTEVLENSSTNTWRIENEGGIDFLDFFQFTSIENAFFFNTDATFKNFSFNPLSSPYRFEVIEGDNTSSTLKLRFDFFWEGEDQTFGSASTYEVTVNLTIQKVN